MTPKQKRAMDMILDGAVKKMIAYEITKEPDDRSPFARVTLRSGSAYDEFSIGIDGYVAHRGMSQSYNKALSTLVQSILRKAKKLEKEP